MRSVILIMDGTFEKGRGYPENTTNQLLKNFPSLVLRKLKMENEHQSDYATIGNLIKKMHNATKDEEGKGCASMFAAAVFAGLLINSNENDPKEKTEYITEAIRVLKYAAQHDFDEVLALFDLEIMPEFVQ